MTKQHADGACPPDPTPTDGAPPDLTPDDVAAVMDLLGYDPGAVSAVIISLAGVHAIAATLVEPTLTTVPEEDPDADT